MAEKPSAIFGLGVLGNNLWVGTPFGLSRIDLKSGQAEDVLLGAASPTVYKISPLGSDRLIAQTGSSLYYTDGGPWRPFQIPSEARSVMNWGVDKDGIVWEQIWQLRSYLNFRYSSPAPPAAGEWKGELLPMQANRWDMTACAQWQSFTQNNEYFRSPEECRLIDQARQTIRATTQNYAVLIAVDGKKDAWWVTTSSNAKGQLMLGRIGADGASTTVSIAAHSGTAIATSPSGGVWVGTDLGLAHWDGHTVQWKQLHANECRLPANPQIMAVGDQGQVWISSGNSVYALDQASNTWQAVKLALPGSPGQPITAMAAAPHKSLWIVQRQRMSRAGDRPTPPVDIPNSCSPESLTSDTLGDAWIWNGGCNLLRYIPAKGEPSWTQYPQLGSVDDVAAGPNGKVYALASGKLHVFEQASQAWTSLVDVAGYRLAVGAQGQVWIIGQENGVLRLWQWTGQALQAAPAQPVDKMPVAMAADGKSRVWAATSNRLLMYDGQSWRSIPAPADSIANIAVGPDGRVWVRAGDRIGVYDPALDKN